MKIRLAGGLSPGPLLDQFDAGYVGVVRPYFTDPGAGNRVRPTVEDGGAGAERFGNMGRLILLISARAASWWYLPRLGPP